MRISNILVLISTFQFSALAIAERPEHPEHFDHPPRCDQGRVNACIEANRVAGDHARLGASSLDPEINAINQRIDSVRVPLRDLQMQVTSEEEEEKLLSSEISFLGKNQKNSAEILPGFPSVEIFFRLHSLHKSWWERFPKERAQILTSRLADSLREKADLSVRLGKISSEFEGLNGQIQSVLAQKGNLLAEARQHDVMCNSGCLDEICPPRN